MLSGARGWVRAAVVLGAIVAVGPAAAQSDRLREAVRLHAPDAQARAEAERAACQEVRCPTLTELTLLTGYLALSDGDAKRALGLLGSAPAPAGLEPWHHFYLGQALFYTRDYARAAAAFARAQKTGPASLSERARGRYGEALLQAGKAKEALPHIEQTAKRATPELLHLRARARALAGKKAEAQADLTLLALRHATHPLGEEAWAALRAHKPPFTPTADQRVQRIRALLEGGQPRSALAELDALGGDAPAVGLLRAQVLYALGEDPRAEEALKGALAGPRPLAAEAAMLRARRALREGDRPKARALMKEVADTYRAERPAEDALYLAGWVALQQGESAEAVALFKTFAERFPSARRNDEVLWFRALAHLRADEHALAQQTLGELLTRFPRSSLVPQARYWSTRAAQLGGGKKDALTAGYRQVATSHPASFYGMLSRLRLHDLGEEKLPAFAERPGALDEAVPAELAVAQRLTQAGLYRDAHAEVDARLGAVRDAGAALRYGHALARIGAYGYAYQLAARHLWGRAFTERQPEAIALLFPLAWRGTVEKEAAAQSVPHWLVWAIMRRESAFRPEVSSPADARGLMQIIPPTARAIAKELGDAAPPPDALYAPEVNIRYGAWYLGKLQERFEHPALVAAAYNAGPPAVLGWLQGGQQLPLDLFVELIPYKETRGYVKQVMADYHLYQALYEEPAKVRRLPIVLPAPRADGVSF
jgi:soluble lytic murein transglycosylase